MTVTLQLSDSPTDKLQAALNHDWNDRDREFPVEYLRACARWFAGLSGHGCRIAGSAIWVFASGDETSAVKIAADLPAAPIFPL